MLFFGALSLPAQQRTILAIGAHAADMELTAGPILAHQKLLGDRIVILHLTLGEAGNPKLAPAKYAEQKEVVVNAKGETLLETLNELAKRFLEKGQAEDKLRGIFR